MENKNVDEKNVETNQTNNNNQQPVTEQNAEKEKTAEEMLAELLENQNEDEEEERKGLPIFLRILIWVALFAILGIGVFLGISMLTGNVIKVTAYHGQVHEDKVVVHEIKKGTAVRYIPSIEKEGWIFDGWYVDSEYETKYNINTSLNEDVTIYGRYRESMFIVTYHDEDETVIETYADVAYGTDMTEIHTAIPTKEDKQYLYTFEKWVNINGEDIDLTNVKHNIDAYAQYNKVLIEYSLTINNTSTGTLTVKRDDVEITEQDILYYGDLLEITYVTTEGYKVKDFIIQGATVTGDKYLVNNNVVINYSERVKGFIVTFYDENKTTILHTVEDVSSGQSVIYPGIPTKPEDEANIYEFNRWTDIDGNPVDLTNITSDLNVYATFEAQAKKFYFTTNAYDKITVTKDGNVITAVDEFYYGDTLVITYTETEGYHCKELNVTGANQNRTSYIVTGNVYIEYIEEINTFTVTFYNDNKTTVVHTIEDVVYNSNIEYTGVPTKDNDTTYSYTFDKWLDANGNDAVFTNITKNTSYYASYTKEYIEYTITINNETTGKVDVTKDGTPVQLTDTFHYGDKLEITYTPTEKYAMKVFTVEGATLNGSKYVVNGNVVITYEEVQVFTVYYYDYDKTLIHVQENVEYGTTPNYTTIPTRESDTVYSYTFREWTNEQGTSIDLSSVTSDLRVYAAYDFGYRVYTLKIINNTTATITVKRGEDEILDNGNVYYDDVLEITYIPSEGCAVDTFEVQGATKQGESYIVTGNVTIKYTETSSVYTVNYYDEDKTTLLRSMKVAHGREATYSTIPNKNGDKVYSYTFKEWVYEDGTTADLSQITQDTNVYASYTGTYKEYSLTIINTSTGILVVKRNGMELSSSDILYYGDKLEVTYETTIGYNVNNFKVTGANFVDGEYVVEDNVTINYSEILSQYTVTYYDEDKTTVIYTLRGVDYNTTAEYAGKPVKNADNYYVYTFDKWLDIDGNEAVLTNITSDVSVYASYTQSDREYTLSINKSKTGVVAVVKAGEELTTQNTLHYDDEIEITYTTTEGYTLTTFEVEGATLKENNTYTVTGNVVVTYQEDINIYTVSFYDEDKTTLLETKQVAHGSGTYYNFTKEPTKTFIYTFESWNNFDGEVVDLENVTQSLNVYPIFKENYIEYKLTINKSEYSTVIVKRGDAVLTESSILHYQDILTVTYEIREGCEFVSFSVEGATQNGDSYIVEGDVVVNFQERILTYAATVYTTESDYQVFDIPRNLPIWENIPQLDPEKNYINDEYTCGFYLDPELAHMLPRTQLLTEDITLYTRIATLDKLSFSYVYDKNNEKRYFTVRAFNNTIPGEVVIPLVRKYDGKYYNVTEVSTSGFSDCSKITNVVFSPYMNKLSRRAFYGCSSLESITIPDTIKTLGIFAFKGCTGLREINYYAKNLNLVTDDHNTLSYYLREDNNTFEGSEKGLKLNISNEVQSIPPQLFAYSKITELNFEEGSNCTRIGENAFLCCDNLTILKIPESVTGLSSGFKNCHSLTHVYVSSFDQWHGFKFSEPIENPLYYGANLYIADELVENLVIPAHISTVNCSEFSGCGSIKTVTIPDTVTSVENSAFRYCKNMETLNIGRYITFFYNYAFADCTGLKTINYNAYNASYYSNTTSNHSIFENSGSNSCVLNIGTSVSQIPYYLFYESNINSVQFDEGSTCTKINQWAFRECYNLKTFVLPASVTSIGDWAFSNYIEDFYNNSTINLYNNLVYYGLSYWVNIILPADYDDFRIFFDGDFKFLQTKGKYYLLDYLGTQSDIVLPEKINNEIYEIRDYAFYDNDNLTSVTIPTTIQKVGVDAFLNCNNLKKVYMFDLAKWMQIEFNNSNPLQNGADLYLNNELVTDIIVPTEITQINDYVFDGCISLKTVQIPHSVSKIGTSAFERCSNLELINIPDGVTDIGNYALYSCKITELNLPEGILTIGSHAFAYCNNLITINIPTTLTKLGSSAFYGCSNLISDLTIPAAVQSIEYSTFQGCSKITTINLNEGLKNIEGWAFAGCKALVNIQIPTTVRTLGYDSFYSCESITELVIPEGVTQIPYDCFRNCISLKNITIPTTVNDIGYGAFYKCEKLESVVIPEGVTNLYDHSTNWGGAFEYCTSLKSITIPSTMVSIDEDVFRYCDAVESVYISDLSAWLNIDFNYYNNVNGGYYTYANPLHSGADLYLNNQLLTDLTIPTGFTTIKRSSFEGCTSIVNVVIPNGVTTIERDAFKNCSNIKNISFPTSLTTINEYAFINNTSLLKLELPNSLVSLSNSVFSNCTSLTDLVIPTSLTSLSEGLFSGCNNIRNLTIPSSISDVSSAFSGCTKLEVVNIDSLQKWFEYDLYYSIIEDKGIKYYNSSPLQYGTRLKINGEELTELTIPDYITTIDKFTFSGCESLVSLTIPSTVKYIDTEAFSNCTNLQTLIIESGVSLGANVFKGCTSLVNLTISEGVTNLGNGAFTGCTSLETVDLPSTIQTMTNAFAGCTSLTDVTFAQGITTISYGAFSNCENLVNVNLCEGITIVDSSAFAGCSRLRKIILPNSVKEIQDSAFQSCISLTQIELSENLEYIRPYAFRYCSSLTNITIPSKLIEIQDKVFEGTSSLKEILNLSELEIIAGNHGIPANVRIITLEETRFIVQGEFVFYQETDGTYTLYGYTGNSTDVVLPDSIIIYEEQIKEPEVNPEQQNEETEEDEENEQETVLVPVEYGYKIRENLFNNCKYLTSITIPENVLGIGNYAFANCVNLIIVNYNAKLATASGNYLFTNSGVKGASIINIGEKVEYIPDYAFYNSNFKDINFSNGGNLKTIDDYAFNKCNYLTNITIPMNVLIKNYAFAECSNLKNITVLQGCYIGIGAFKSCVVLQSAELKGVVTIADDAFYNNTKLSNLDISAGLQTIGSSAFYNNLSLIDVILPEGLENIGSNAFYGCLNLKSINIPSTVKTMGSDIFTNTESLLEVFNNSQTITIQKGEYGLEPDVSIITPTQPNGIFEENDLRFQLYNGEYYLLEYIGTDENIVLPSSINGVSYKIRQYAFYNLDFIKQVTIPTGVIGIDEHAFRDCSSLTTLTIGDNVGYIETQAFYNCTKLQTVTIGSGLATINDSAFRYCSSLVTVDIGEGLQTIGTYAFSDCTMLTQVTTHAGLSKIMDYAFYGCSALQTIELPEGMTNIASYAFYGCSSLQGIDIPLGVTYIGSYIFFNCKSMVYANLPQGLSNIGDYAFYGCSSLKEIHIPEGVSYLGTCTFYDCINLTTITIPTTVRTLGESLFYNCNSLLSAKIPAGVSAIPACIFYDCISLHTVEIPNTVMTFGAYSFKGCKSLKEVYLPERITYIGNETFYNCESLKEINIPEGVTSIGVEAFYNCKSMETASIPQTVKTIETRAFAGCSSLKEFIIPDAVTIIKNEVFRGCSGMTKVHIPSTVTQIQSSAFAGCSSLLEVVIPDGITTIESSTFSGCSNMVSVTIPATVEVIKDNAFYNCNSLLELNLPSILTTIGSYAFRYCTSLTELYIPDSVISIGNRTFDDCTNLDIVVVNNMYIYERVMTMNQGRIIENASQIYILKTVADLVETENEVILGVMYTIDKTTVYNVYDNEYYKFVKIS